MATVKGRSRAVAIQTTTLTSLLDQLLLSFDLVWFQDDLAIHILKADELKNESMQENFAFDSAVRAFRRFGVDFPDSRSRQSALLSRAGLALAQNEYDIAGQLYKELEQTNPVNEIQAKLFFNRGKLSLLLNRQDEAKQFFYLAVDQAMSPNIESSAYCMLSRIHLLAGQVEETIRTARRGLATAVTPEQRQIAILYSARAYLLNNDPFSANTTIFRNQSFIVKDEHKKIAALLGSYARFTGVGDTRRGEIARNRMLSAVGQIKDHEYQAFADCYVASMAYESLGFPDHAMKMLALALTKSDAGAWKRQTMFELGMLQKKAKNFSEAISTFTALRDGDDRWRSKALYQLATVYNTINQTDLCIETCRELWQSELDDSQKTTHSQLLGTAFQAKGEYHSAALCFAGMLPDEY